MTFDLTPVHRVFVSGGDEVDGLRDIGLKTFRVLEQVFRRVGVSLAITNWDFRIDSGEDVAAGEFSARSLYEVGASHIAIGVFGTQVPLPPTSKEEMEEVYRLMGEGSDITARLLFAQPMTATHGAWHRHLQELADRDIIYETYDGPVDFQRRFMANMTELLIPDHMVVRERST